ncbi:MAG: DNA polymerase [Bellilinea sp.]
MKLITLDFETYYGNDYTLSKMTTESYIRDNRFEAIMVGIQIDHEKPYTVVGREIDAALQDLDLPSNAVLCHHSHFDGLILSHHYGLCPKIWLDTLPMGRAELGSVISRGMSLGSMSEHLGLGVKGHEVVQAKGKRLSDFTAEELRAYQGYCANDVTLTRRIYDVLIPNFAVSELKLIDLTTRLFTEPVLELDTEILEEYREQVLRNKEFLMLRAGVTREECMSGNKFADVLRRFGVEPEMKDSATAKNPDGTPKRTYAFAKTDDAMKRLLEHDNETIQALAEARLGVKTTIAETRATRFIDMSHNGAACVYLKYWGAEQTGRHGGGDACNWQNLGRSASLTEEYARSGANIFTPEGWSTIKDPGLWGLTKIATGRGQFKVKDCHRIGLRDSVRAPKGMKLVVGDSSNIEARKVCWISGQEDVLEKYRAGEDLYCEMASAVYERMITKADKERQLGKVAVLGLGFGMGKDKFYDTATGSQWRIDIERPVTDAAVDVFRTRYDKVVAFWRYLNDRVIPAMADGKEIFADPRQLIRTGKECLILPNGRRLRYPNLHQRKNTDPDSYFKTEWVFDVREGARVIKSRLYGGKLCENIVQALARIIVLDQAVEISRRYKVVLLVHDEVVACVPDSDAEACEKFVLEVMSKTPDWAKGMPLAAETGIAQIYSLAK